MKGKDVLKWAFGVMFLLAGLGTFHTSLLVGTIFVFLGLFILPPTYDFIEKKAKITLPSWVKWTTVIGVFFISSFAISEMNSENEEKADLLVINATEHLHEGEIDSAIILINEAKELYASPSNKAVDLEKELENSKSNDFADETLAMMSDQDFSKLEGDSLTTAYFPYNRVNTNFINLLRERAPYREKVINKIQARKERERIAAEKAEEEKKRNERKKLVEKQFSSWDGSHRGLTNLIKENMGDPDSYEHIDTKFRDDGKTIFVITKFRGINAFGGKVINTVSAVVDFEGNVLRIVAQD